MTYSLLNPQPALRADTLSYDDVGPGLYVDECALELDDGTLVAVSVETKWLSNGAGVQFTGYARSIMPDGSTCRCPTGQPLETVLGHSADLKAVEDLGIEVVRREMILAMLGEPLTTHFVESQGDVPLIEWGTDGLRSVCIRTAIATAQATGSNASNPAALLGL